MTAGSEPISVCGNTTPRLMVVPFLRRALSSIKAPSAGPETTMAAAYNVPRLSGAVDGSQWGGRDASRVHRSREHGRAASGVRAEGRLLPRGSRPQKGGRGHAARTRGDVGRVAARCGCAV